jgi:hypothetical protein
MIDALISVADRLIQLKEFQTVQLRLLFDRLIEPIFNDLSNVHQDYLKMFEDIYDSLPYSWEIGSTDYNSRVALCVKQLKKKRLEFEPIRVKVLAVTDELKRQVKNPGVIEFVESAINYFPKGEVFDPSSNMKYSAYTSSSSKLIGEFYLHIEKQTAENLRECVDCTLKHHRDKWKIVSEEFARLKILVVTSG